jgi:hypothetical protein
MPGCVLRVGGTNLDPDIFLPTTALRAYRTWRRGDPMAKTGPRAQLPHSDGGFCCDVSSTNGDLRGQIKDAEAFLLTHRADFDLIASTSLIEECQLDFGFDSRLGENVAVQCEYLPVSFLALVGELRVAVVLSLYPGVSAVCR